MIVDVLLHGALLLWVYGDVTVIVGAHGGAKWPHDYKPVTVEEGLESHRPFKIFIVFDPY